MHKNTSLYATIEEQELWPLFFENEYDEIAFEARQEGALEAVNNQEHVKRSMTENRLPMVDPNIRDASLYCL